MIGDSHSPHAITYGFVNQLLYAGLTIKDGILCVDVQMYEIFHNS